MRPGEVPYSVDISRLLTSMPEYINPHAPAVEDTTGTPYEKVDVIQIVPLDRLWVAVPTVQDRWQSPFFAIDGEPKVKKYIVMTTKKIAYDQLQKPKSDLHNIHYKMRILLHEEVSRNIYIAVLHFLHGKRVLEVTHKSTLIDGWVDWDPAKVEIDEWNDWTMLKDRIVHRMDDIPTCKELLYDDPQSFEFHPSSDSLGSIVPIIETIGWESLEEDVMEGK